MDNVSQKRNAILGFIGGLIFVIGDLLLYIFPGRNKKQADHGNNRQYDSKHINPLIV